MLPETDDNRRRFAQAEIRRTHRLGAAGRDSPFPRRGQRPITEVAGVNAEVNGVPSWWPACSPQYWRSLRTGRHGGALWFRPRRRAAARHGRGRCRVRPCASNAPRRPGSGAR
jgi:hypothetical protein